MQTSVQMRNDDDILSGIAMYIIESSLVSAKIGREEMLLVEVPSSGGAKAETRGTALPDIENTSRVSGRANLRRVSLSRGIPFAQIDARRTEYKIAYVYTYM